MIKHSGNHNYSVFSLYSELEYTGLLGRKAHQSILKHGSPAIFKQQNYSNFLNISSFNLVLSVNTTVRSLLDILNRPSLKEKKPPKKPKKLSDRPSNPLLK